MIDTSTTYRLDPPPEFKPVPLPPAPVTYWVRRWWPETTLGEEPSAVSDLHSQQAAQ